MDSKTFAQNAKSGAKRAVEVFFAAVLLVLLAPVIAALAALVRLFLGAPVFYTQRREGRGGIPFTIYKLRSMTDQRSALGELLPDLYRLTKFGKVLRQTGLDELPQLWNVLRGDMSLVGPRPLPVAYLNHYSPAHARRHEIRPGITGWAQVNGRNELDWARQLELDAWYVDHRSLSLDLRILYRSILLIFRRTNANTIRPAFEGADSGPDDAGQVLRKH
jgi:sugar transferase EpsL